MLSSFPSLSRLAPFRPVVDIVSALSNIVFHYHHSVSP